ncbi:MAG: 4-amino-4-deoxy-L-arabinose transferase [bacterium]
MGHYLMLGFSILLAVTGQLLMKKGMMVFGQVATDEFFQRIIPMLLNPYVFSGIACFGFSAMTWLVVLSKFELSFVYPLVSVAYILVAIASMVFFQETVPMIRWLGIAVIVFGVFLISRS